MTAWTRPLLAWFGAALVLASLLDPWCGPATMAVCALWCLVRAVPE